MTQSNFYCEPVCDQTRVSKIASFPTSFHGIPCGICEVFVWIPIEDWSRAIKVWASGTLITPTWPHVFLQQAPGNCTFRFSTRFSNPRLLLAYSAQPAQWLKLEMCTTKQNATVWLSQNQPTIRVSVESWCVANLNDGLRGMTLRK